jgi:inner membrane protein
MMGSSHILIGTTAAAWTAYLLPVPPSIKIMVVGVGVVGSMIPDLDHINSRASRSIPDARYVSLLVRQFGSHRTVTHDPRIGPTVFAILTGLAFVFIRGPIGEAWWAFAIAMWIGCLSHLWADARTTSGIPFGDRRLTLGRTFRTGSDRETWLRTTIYKPVAIVSVVAVLYLTTIP